MKRKYTYRKRKHRYGRGVHGPSVFAWSALILAWLSLLPISAYLFQPKTKPEQNREENAASAFAQVSDAQSISQEPAEPHTDPLEPTKITMDFLPAILSLRADDPTILIYHTHTTEAYTQTETETYRESSKWRTNDASSNMIAVGEALKEILETQYGFRVIHDTTDHEPPKLATAYDRSLITMERYHKEYPSIVLFIDLHRDAYDTTNAPCDYLTVDGVETARLMLVVGRGEKYEEKPYFDSNIRFAERITEHLNSIAPKLARPIREKKGRYNQHVAPNCILVEVGHNANTLSQAKAAMPYLAESIVYAFRAQEPDVSDWAPN